MEELENTHRINFTVPISVIRFNSKHEKRQFGRIINIASIAAIQQEKDLQPMLAVSQLFTLQLGH